MNRYMIAYRYRHHSTKRWCYVEGYAYVPSDVDVATFLKHKLYNSEVLHISAPRDEHLGVWGGTYQITKTALVERGLIGG